MKTSVPRTVRSRPHPLVELTRARVLEFVREPEAWFWTFVFPILLALVLGVAFRSKPPDKLRVCLEVGADAQRVAELLASAPDIEVKLLSQADSTQALANTATDLVIVVTGPWPITGGLPQLTYRFDPTRVEARSARIAVDHALLQAVAGEHGPEVVVQPVSHPGSRYIDFLIPGLIGLNLMGSGMWGLGFAVVQARVAKLLKLFAVTPMRRVHFLLSFMLSRLLWLFGEVVVLVGAGRLLFGMPVRGSLQALALVSVLGAGMFAGIGLLVAARPKTLEGVSGMMNLVMMPMWLFSGTFFSYQRFPDSVQSLLRLLPLTALNDALRAILLLGQPLFSCWVEIAVMLFWSVLSFALALRIFRWQ